MEHTRIKELLNATEFGHEVIVKGWVKTFRNNQFIDSRSITYDEVVQGSNSTTLMIPGEELEAIAGVVEAEDIEVVDETPPSDEPVQAEVTDSDEEAGEEHEQQSE